ncbi:hypothetical protein PLIIFM63780_005722 [Purpureocillium lilacinum]|uniref:Cupin 2 domain-containing protein n=1 Tax=Purpureocillium lilacinum TaxID=33203 RepID=A0A179GN54_PURLI|nr:hypothetical protein Purlil1_2455 [Purpureocillium lilacinum]OAQ78751.1 cupin 2 domain-containing protein [Purpureocillium lilacinum]GJN82185.1 hypothetical protein PLIIFM63780_005722 [Purpureocillium lilacinum]
MSGNAGVPMHQLPPARLVRTSHTEDGKSIISSDSDMPSFSPFGPQGSSFAVFDVRNSIPVTNTDPISSFSNTLPRCPPGGSVFCITDIKPGGRAPMHRTQSIDYCIVLSGEIVIRLDGGEQRTVRSGEFIVQQGVNHQWINEAQETCRIAFVMLGAQEIVLSDGLALEEAVFQGQK